MLYGLPTTRNEVPAVPCETMQFRYSALTDKQRLRWIRAAEKGLCVWIRHPRTGRIQINMWNPRSGDLDGCNWTSADPFHG
jgi:hypothetical protein